MEQLKKILKSLKIYGIILAIKEGFYNFINKSSRQNFYSFFVKENNLCFDVGANMGNRTEIFLSLGARVVAVEPQELCFKSLQKKYYTNENVELVNMALGKKEGEGKIFTGESSTLATMSKDWISKVEKTGRFGNEVWDKSQAVRITTLDKLIEKYGLPNFCKIDVEGFEFEVLSGLSKPIKALSFEFVSESLESTEKCIQLLSKIGKYKFNYSNDESMQFVLEEWTDNFEIIKNLNHLKDGSWGDVYAILN